MQTAADRLIDFKLKLHVLVMTMFNQFSSHVLQGCVIVLQNVKLCPSFIVVQMIEKPFNVKVMF